MEIVHKTVSFGLFTISIFFISAMQSSEGATLSISIIQLTFLPLCSETGRSLARVASKRHLLLAVTATARHRRKNRITFVHVHAGIFDSLVCSANHAKRQHKHSETVDKRNSSVLQALRLKIKSEVVHRFLFVVYNCKLWENESMHVFDE